MAAQLLYFRAMAYWFQGLVQPGKIRAKTGILTAWLYYGFREGKKRKGIDPIGGMSCCREGFLVGPTENFFLLD